MDVDDISSHGGEWCQDQSF